MNEKQKKVYDCLVDFKREHDGCTPSYAHIAEKTGIESKGTINYTLNALEEAGHIRRPYHFAQHIEIVGGRWVAPDEEKDYNLICREKSGKRSGSR